MKKILICLTLALTMVTPVFGKSTGLSTGYSSEDDWCASKTWRERNKLGEFAEKKKENNSGNGIVKVTTTNKNNASKKNKNSAKNSGFTNIIFKDKSGNVIQEAKVDYDSIKERDYIIPANYFQHGEDYIVDLTGHNTINVASLEKEYSFLLYEKVKKPKSQKSTEKNNKSDKSIASGYTTIIFRDQNGNFVQEVKVESNNIKGKKYIIPADYFQYGSDYIVDLVGYNSIFTNELKKEYSFIVYEKDK
ncbi:MAG: hypothetical protein ACK5LT_13980 [Lachnospirales bacterium]